MKAWKPPWAWRIWGLHEKVVAKISMKQAQESFITYLLKLIFDFEAFKAFFERNSGFKERTSRSHGGFPTSQSYVSIFPF